MKVSNCCGAVGNHGLTPYEVTFIDIDLCPKCGEHCEYVEEEETQKTALMELIDWMTCDTLPLPIPETLILAKATELLQKERQQIEEAVDSVCIVSRRYYSGGGFGDDDLGKEITSPDINNDGNDYFGLSITGSDYYAKTFTNESK